MATFVINSKCNLNCSYCFASKHINNNPDRDMSKKEFLDLLQFTEGQPVSFCGGEPTLHPMYVDFLQIALSEKLKVKVLTNGLWSEGLRKNVPVKYKESLLYSIHILEKKRYQKNQIEAIYKTLETLNDFNKVFLISFDGLDFDDSFLLELIEKFSIKKIVYSISILRDSKYISTKDELSKWGTFVYNFILKMQKHDVEVDNNCGYLPMCAYTDEQRKYFLSNNVNSAKFKCTRPSYDFGIDNKNWRCFMLKDDLTLDNGEFSGFDHLYSIVKSRMTVLDKEMPFKDCYDCIHYKEKNCGGGCYYYKLNKVKMLTTSKDLSLNMVPIINNDILKKDTSENYLINNDFQVIEFESNDLLNNVYKYCNGKDTISEMAQKLNDEFYEDLEIAKNDLLAFFKEMFNLGVINFKK